MVKQYKVQHNTVPERILMTAKELFVEKGYKHTTIRQIVERSGVQIGSIYHFYKNKEEIVEAVMFMVIEQSTVIMDICFAEETPVFKYAAIVAVWMKAIGRNEFIRESYYAAYTSDTIFERMVEFVTDLLVELFRYKTPTYTREDYFLRVLLLKGAMRSCIVKFNFEKDIPSKQCFTMLMHMTLPMFGFDEKEIQDVLVRVVSRDKNLTGIANKLITESITI